MSTAISSPRSLALMAGVLLTSSPLLHAIQVVTNPVDDPRYPYFHDPGDYPLNFPSANLGQYGGASAIYLGDVANNSTYWVITAAHIGTFSTVKLEDVSYNVIERIRLQNKPEWDVDRTNTDLLMLRLDLNDDPGNARALKISSTPVVAGQPMALLGRGSGGQNWAYSTVSNVTVVYPGNPEEYPLTPVGNTRDNRSFATLTIDSPLYSPNADYGWALSGDSGGGVFYYDSIGEEWILQGVLQAIMGGTWEGNPLHYSLAAHLPDYYDVITTIPEPGTYAMLALTGLGFTLWHLRRKKSGVNCF